MVMVELDDLICVHLTALKLSCKPFIIFLIHFIICSRRFRSISNTGSISHSRLNFIKATLALRRINFIDSIAIMLILIGRGQLFWEKLLIPRVSKMLSLIIFMRFIDSFNYAFSLFTLLFDFGLNHLIIYI